MAMNKAEKAQLEEALRQAAFRRTGPVERDLPPPEYATGDYTQGWDINLHTGTAFEAWSGVVSHGTGKAPTPGKRYSSASQNPCRLYSTKAKALAALRYLIEERAATDLRNIDIQLEAEKEAP